MATLHAGVKRSWNQMHAGNTSTTTPTTTSNSGSPRAQTPLDTKPNEGLEVLENAASSTSLQPTHRQSSFAPDASVVLVGVKGTGKSSLGVLAASAYRRRLIESERVFYDVVGHTAASYRRLKGSTHYHRRHHEVLEQLLEQHTNNAIIILNFADLEASGAELLRNYAQCHPVIHVMRDAKGVFKYLNMWSEDLSLIHI